MPDFQYDLVKSFSCGRKPGARSYGLVASSKAQRLKPHAFDIRVDVDPIHYFLDGKDDMHSSYFLEDAATESQVQGLELDWTRVTWDAGLRWAGTLRVEPGHDDRSRGQVTVRKTSLIVLPSRGPAVSPKRCGGATDCRSM